MRLEGTSMVIVNVNGSPHASIGNTQAIVNLFVYSLKERGVEVELINHYIVKEKVEECRGCTRCMRSGVCPQSSKDDVKTIVDDLLRADFVIFSSPIFVLNVTGLMKKFFDRTAYMTHRLSLENKIGAVVLSSLGLGVETVTSYMNSVVGAMGVKIIGTISGVAIVHGQFSNLDEIKSNVDSIIHALEFEDYKDEADCTQDEIERRNKFQMLMDNEEVSKTLFREDYKYWMERKQKNE